MDEGAGTVPVLNSLLLYPRTAVFHGATFVLALLTMHMQAGWWAGCRDLCHKTCDVSIDRSHRYGTGRVHGLWTGP